MNPINPNQISQRPVSRLAPILAAAAALLLAPCVYAQTPAPAVKEAPVSAVPAQDNGVHLATESGARLYAMKFDGGTMPRDTAIDRAS